MDTYHLPVETRQTGKKAAKAVRTAGRVPCVLYGAHTAPVHFSAEVLALRPLVHTTETYRVAFSLDGDDHEAIVKEITFHPVTDTPIHVDFQALTRGEAITITVPVHVEGNAAGVLEGGQLSQPLHEIEIRSLPRDIPGHLSVDVTALGIGDSLTVGDLQVPAGVKVLTDPELALVSVVGLKADEGLEAADAATAEAAEAQQADAAEAEDDADEAADADEA